MASFEGLQVDLYLRDEVSPAVAEQQQRVRSRLEGTVRTGALTVHEHPKRVPAADESPLYDRYADARAWASDADVSLSPFFECRESYDPGVAQVREMVTLPVLWLTLTGDTGVRATYPHVDGEVETVSDAVGDIVDGERPPAGAAD